MYECMCVRMYVCMCGRSLALKSRIAEPWSAQLLWLSLVVVARGDLTGRGVEPWSTQLLWLSLLACCGT